MAPAERPELVATEYSFVDDRFMTCRGDRWLELLYRGCGWAEGPAWFPAGRYLVWSDIPSNRILRFDETSGTVGVFRQPSGNANGNTVDYQGRLVSCEHGTRRVTRTEQDGSITVLAERYQGKRLNSPNDVVVHSDGSVLFTDPDYGIRGWYQGGKAEREQASCRLYRVDPVTGAVEVAADDFDQPNGLALSLDERTLYVVDSGRQQLRAFEVGDTGKLSGGEVLATVTGRFGYDGIRLDDEGRIWAAVGAGVRCYHPDGTLLGGFTVPELVANVEFGGEKRNRLFITATTCLYSIRLGARAPRLRPPG